MQVLLDEERYERLEAEAKRRRAPIAAVVRDAIDQAYPAGANQRRNAARAVLAAAMMPVGDPEDLKAEISEARAGHL